MNILISILFSMVVVMQSKPDAGYHVKYILNEPGLSLESELNKIIEAYPGKFSSIKGEKPGENEYWISNFKMEGAQKCFIMNMSGFPLFISSYILDSEYKIAAAKFDDLASKMESVKINCCIFRKNKEDKEIEWTIENPKPGFENLRIKLSLKRNWSTKSTTPKYEVDLRVYDKRYDTDVPGM